jgi:tetratricopeptide (TPR) repeat protein
LRLWLLLGLAGAACAAAHAAPHIPASDAMVVETVPFAAELRPLEKLRQAVAAHPEDLRGALTLAQRYLDIGRANADPRIVSYAQAVLTPWLRARAPDPSALVLAATALQYLHRFEESLELLDRALLTQPANGQALLIRASIKQLQGRFEEARQSCRRLIEANGQLIALICLTGIDSLTGKLEASYLALRSVFHDDPRLPSAIRVWALDELADMAERSGDARSAALYLIDALRADPASGYTKAQYADLLLAAHRDDEVVQLLRADELQDNLLLRLAIAGTHLEGLAGRRWREMYRARYEAALRDGDFTHVREHARFLLAVEHDPSRALELAERDWGVQHEPADVRLYLAAAAAAQDTGALRRVRQWIERTHYEDRALMAAASPALLGAAP